LTGLAIAASSTTSAQIPAWQLMMITLGGQNPKYEPFAEGWLENGKMWGRPSYLYQMPDGAFLLSDDYNGCIYRVSYSG